ncbi:MAG: hypothetical protein UZ12_BCD005003175 [Bacteroidetes bacterium OLB12]|nr:MAG: hypothetical protein UZ12_BCD005003175 [Bacteroidetes bacterium OLB12]
MELLSSRATNEPRLRMASRSTCTRGSVAKGSSLFNGLQADRAKKSNKTEDCRLNIGREDTAYR